MTDRTIQRIEAGEVRAYAVTAHKIASALDVDVDTLLPTTAGAA